LKISPWEGITRVRKKGKLNPRYMGPYEILARVGEVAYQLAFLEHSHIQDVFHVLGLRQYMPDSSHVLAHQLLELKEDLTYEKHPMQILNRKEQVLRAKEHTYGKGIMEKSGSRRSDLRIGGDLRVNYP
jgi:hypothetical protein